MATKRNLSELLGVELGPDFTVWKFPHAGRTLILKRTANDLQVGFKIDRGKSRGVTVESVDVGLRIPSVEDMYDSYEIFAMRKMGFREAKPSGWLTFWRPSRFLSKADADHGAGVKLIISDFLEFYNAVISVTDDMRDQFLAILSQAHRPAWATAPGSTMLITKALLARTLLYPGLDACDAVNGLVATEPITSRGEVIIEQFCAWLRATHLKSTDPE